MATWFDCASPLTKTTAAAFKHDGYEGVARYLVPLPSWKGLTPAEAQLLTDAGLKIISVFETEADRVLDGYAAGKNDATTALKLASAVKQPQGSAIYFAIDFDAQEKHMTAIKQYYKGVKEVLGSAYIPGAYGPALPLKALLSDKLIGAAWQAYANAWSGGDNRNKVPGVNFRQIQNGLTVNNWSIDHDEAYGGHGWWNTDGDYEGRTPKSTVFPDIPAGHWAEASVARMKAAGLLAGKSDGTFGGGAPVTRYELAVALDRLYSALKVKDSQ